MSQSELQLPSQPIPQPSSSSLPAPSSSLSPSVATKPDITQDFKDLKSFLESCDCLKWESVLDKEEISVKRLPNFREQDFKEMGLSRGAARELDLALMKYRLNHHESNENKVCVHIFDRVLRV